jgi:zinc transport system substrate-binding protein
MPRPRHVTATAALGAGALVLGGVLSGCAALSGADQEGTQVATAFYPLQYVAERVAGDLADVENLTQPGKEPHDLELTIRETATVANADLVVFERDFQPAVDATVDQNATGEVIDAASVVDLEPFANGDPNPHFWLDPLRMADLGDAVAARLADIDPPHADTFEANAADLRADLEALDAAYTRGLADCERNTVVVSHDAFGYLAKYGLAMEPIAGLSPEAEPTPADLGRLQDLIRSDGITTVFSERLASPRLTEALAHDLGIRTAVLDPIEGLTEETSDEDYLSLMRENLAALEEANGCR